jgi:hypothetical protein
MRRATIAIAAAGVTLGVAATPAAAFTARVTNPYFPLAKGMTWKYQGVKDGRRMVDLVRVTGRVRRIEGVPCAVVADWTWLDGKLAERTTDWYTQDGQGTVWYYGERTAQLNRRGRVVTRDGSWQAGRRGARPGVFMPARPRAGRSFAQEHFPGHAEDHFRVISRHSTATVPFGTFRGRVLLTHEWTPLEPDVLDGKWYVKGVGEVRETALKGPAEDAALVAFHR